MDQRRVRGRGATLIGRADEWARIESALNTAASGHCTTVLIEGEAGIGKSRLVQELRSVARDIGSCVLIGRADQLEQMRPLAAIVDALRSAEIDIGDDLRALVRDAGAEHRLVDALVDLIERLAVNDAVIVILEDLHWADAPTIGALRSILRRLPYVPVLLVGTYRPHPIPPDLPRLLDAVTREDGTTVVLQRLSDTEVAQLAQDLLGAPIGPGLSTVLSAAGGNPLFVSELVRALQDERLIEIADGVADADPGPMPASLRVTILRRLSFLPAKTTQALRAASVLGSSFALEELAAMVDSPTLSTASLIQPAIESKVLAERGAGFAFRHDLIQEAIYTDIPLALRTSLHLEAARAMRALAASSERVAEHLLRGAHIASQDVIAMLEQAIGELGFSAPDLSIELRRRVIELIGDGDPRTDRYRLEMLIPLASVGRSAEALALSERMLASGLGPETDALIRQFRYFVRQREGRIAECIAELEETAADIRVSEATRLQIEIGIASAHAGTGQVDAARRLGEALLPRIRELGDNRATVGTLTVLGGASFAQGYAAQGLDHVIEALETDLQLRTTVPHPHAQVGIAQFLSDRFTEGRRALAEGRQRDTDAGELPSLAAYGQVAALIGYHEGEWDDAVAEGESALELMSDGMGTSLFINLAWPSLIQIPLRRGDLNHAREIARRAREWTMQDGHRLYVDAVHVSDALCREADGDVAGAFDVAWEAWTESEQGGLLIGLRVAGPELVRLALLNEHPEKAASVVAAAERLACRGAGIPWMDGVALRCRGLLEDSPDALLASVEAYRRGPSTFDRALAAEDAAISLARAGRLEEAKPLFDEALGIYDDVGATRDSARCAAAMRVAGIRRGSRASRDRPVAGWASLTPKEREVARMAAEGLTNPQIAERLFVSKYTVMTHLSHVFAKLEISSRVELAAAAARGSISPTP